MSNLRITIQLTKEGFGTFLIPFEFMCFLTGVFIENIRSVMLTLHKYLSLLRSSELAPWNQQEISDLSALSFRFAEKRAPDHYAISITDYMAYPVPRNLLISGPRVIQPWDLTDPENGGEKEMKELLNLCTVERSRALYMGPKAEFERVKGAIDWQTEKWYGTQYYVERFSEDFVKEVCPPSGPTTRRVC